MTQNIETKSKAETLYPLIKGIDAISDNAIFDFKPYGLDINIISEDKSSMCFAKIVNSNFISYKPNNEKSKINIDIKKLGKIIPRKNAEISLKIIDDSLEIKIIEETTIFPIEKLDQSNEKEPKLIPTTIWKIEAERFRDILKQAELTDKYIQISTNQKEVIFSAEAEGKFNYIMQRNKFNKYSSTSSEAIISLYDISKLKLLIKQAKKLDSIEIAYSKDEPIRIDYIINNIKFRYYLAPFILEKDNPNEEINNN